MKIPTREEQRRLVRQWDETGPLLERIRREALRGKPYDWREVEAVLDLGFQDGMPSRESSGLVEMQHWFIKAAQHQGLIPPSEPPSDRG